MFLLFNKLRTHIYYCFIPTLMRFYIVYDREKRKRENILYRLIDMSVGMCKSFTHVSLFI